MEEIIGGILRPLSRFLIEVVFHTIFELLFQLPAHLICKLFFGKKREPGDGWVFFVSVLFWLLVAIVGFSVF